MASSQVQIASSSSQFGYILRDRNHREPCIMETNKVKPNHRHHHHHHHHSTFQRNIKNLVFDLNTCMAVSSENENENNNNNNNQMNSAKNNHLEKLRFSRSKSSVSNSKNSNNNSSNDSSPGNSRLLDRWAAKQARQMVTNLENEAELLSIEDNETLPRTSSTSSEEDTRNVGGASSLVQIWEKRLNQSNLSRPNTPKERIGSVSSSISSSMNESSIAFSPENVNVIAFSGEEQCFDGNLGNEESFASSSFPDYESSDCSPSPSIRSESERLRVADIIRKLTAANHNQSPTPSLADDNEHEGYGSSVASSPSREWGQQHSEQNHRVNWSLRIRGRQAYRDLLVQMENDRYRELKNLVERGAVSKFPQRGRIQSLFRLRLLQRDVAAANDQPRQKSTASELNNRQPPGSAIMQLRQKFNSGAELRTTVQTEVANPRSSQRETANKTPQLDNSAKHTSNKKGHGNANHAIESTKKSVSQTRIDHSTEEARPSSDVKVQEAHPSSDVKASHNDSQETTKASTSMNNSNLNERIADRAETSNQQNTTHKSSNNDETVNEEVASSQQHLKTSYEERVEEEARHQNYAESSYYDEMEEEAEETDQNCYETNYDWISEISRPRSYWEERRQAWYREMLETDSQNDDDDIRRLLERRTVSSFLSSDLRDRMDRLIQSHRGTQTHLVNIQDLEEVSQGLMTFLQEHMHSTRASQDGRDAREEEEEERRNQEEEEEEEEENEDEHEEESLVNGAYHEAGDYCNPSSSWSYRDNEAGDDFDRAVSASPQPYQSPAFYQEIRQSSPSNPHSMEMELIYDMRGHMLQLYNEISELRKSIKGCMEMQMELQQSMKQEIQTVKKEEKKSNRRAHKKGNCCICYEMKVDSVLYKCGHMCACLKCANELRRNGGKCPICRAKIVDVVRVYVDG